jgi:hypothetical protein
MTCHKTTAEPAGRIKLEDETDELRVSMPEFDRLTESAGWIDLDFVERERTPRQIIQKVVGTIWREYHFRIQLHFLRIWVSDGAE